MIRNLTHLRKKLRPGAQFIIINHRKKEFINQCREVTSSNTQGCYSVVAGSPEHQVSQANNGKGIWLLWEKAANWEFPQTNQCTFYNHETKHTKDTLVFTIELVEGKTDDEVSCKQ